MNLTGEALDWDVLLICQSFRRRGASVSREFHQIRWADTTERARDKVGITQAEIDLALHEWTRVGALHECTGLPNARFVCIFQN